MNGDISNMVVEEQQQFSNDFIERLHTCRYKSNKNIYK